MNSELAGHRNDDGVGEGGTQAIAETLRVNHKLTVLTVTFKAMTWERAGRGQSQRHCA